MVTVRRCLPVGSGKKYSLYLLFDGYEEWADNLNPIRSGACAKAAQLQALAFSVFSHHMSFQEGERGWTVMAGEEGAGQEKVGACVLFYWGNNGFVAFSFHEGYQLSTPLAILKCYLFLFHSLSVSVIFCFY